MDRLDTLIWLYCSRCRILENEQYSAIKQAVLPVEVTHEEFQCGIVWVRQLIDLFV